MSTPPSDYRPPPDSPHVGITLPQHLTVTPSGAPRNKHNVCSCSQTTKSLSESTEEGNHLKPRRTSHKPAHSTRLPKPPGYNPKWSRVTPIQEALVTGPPTKASHHEHPLKRCRKLSSRTRSSGGHHTPSGATHLQCPHYTSTA